MFLFFSPVKPKPSICSLCQPQTRKIRFSFTPILQLYNFLATTTTIPKATPTEKLPQQEKGSSATTSSDHREEQPPKRPTSASYDELIAIAGRSRDLNTLKQLLNQRIIDGCFNTAKTFKFLSEQHVDDQDPWGTLKELTDELTKLSPGYGKKNAFDSLVACLCKSERTDQALFVIQQMFNSQIVMPNAYTFYPLVSAHSRKKEMEKVREVYRMMREKGISPDINCCNLELTALCHSGQVSEAAELLGTMVRGKGRVGEVDSRTFDALVLGACRVGRLDGALALLSRMLEDGVTVLYCTYGHIVRGFLGLGRFREALEFVIGVSGRDNGVDAENFGLLGRCLVRRKRLEEARLVLRQVENRGLNCREELARLLEAATTLS